LTVYKYYIDTKFSRLPAKNQVLLCVNLHHSPLTQLKEV
jgi:hypothetical protein